MDIYTWMQQASPERKAEVADKARTTVAHLYQLSGGHRAPSHKLARRLSAASDGEMTLAKLRPDIWGEANAA